MKNQPIRLRSGENLERTIADYDKDRKMLGDRKLRAVCYAPFLSMDFDATGAVRLCNHSHVEVARFTEDSSVLDIWRGAVYEAYRKDFADYVLDEKNCPHCVRQCQAGSGHHVFATEQFDKWANDDRNPKYPKRLIFRLNSTCNLACVMCDGLTSSRIRKERDQLPPTPSAYGERFFQDMEEILPHVDHVEFYGGEPFLVKEHQRIFEILQKVGAKTSIYVNTNTTAINPKAKEALENLNFTEIAVSMDAVSQEVHGAVRTGMNNETFFRNFDYFLELRERKGLNVMLNVTEHRKNWFELPEVFRFAEKHKVYLHINTCIHPHNVTLYTLPDSELRYVYGFFKEEREALLKEYPEFSNLANYDFLISLVKDELERRTPDWKPFFGNMNHQCDGLLAAPLPGIAPFDRPERVEREATRIVDCLGMESAARMIRDMMTTASSLSGPQWEAAARSLEAAGKKTARWNPDDCPSERPNAQQPA